MNEFDSCVQRIIKQIYPVLAYEYEMGLSESRGESSGTFSFQLLRSLHETSMENINKTLRLTESGDSSKNEFDKSEKKIILEFFTYLNEKKSKLTQKWLSLQHYMHFIYRKLTCPNSQMNNNDLSNNFDVSGFFIAEMKNLVKMLCDADEVQLYLRIFSVLREYVMFAFWQYSKSNSKSSPVERIHHYYQAFMWAAQMIYPVFIDLEQLLKDTCNMTWLNYNKFLFFNYFYDAIHSEILSKVKLQEKLNVPEEFCSMVIDFAELNGLWQTLRNLRGMNDNMEKDLNEDHKEILKKNFWICRKLTDDKQNVQRLAAKLIILASERKIRGSEPILDQNGQCLCEDCLIFKLTNLVEYSDTSTFSKISPCRFCPEIIKLDKLHDHIVDHVMNIVDCTKPSSNLNSTRLKNENNGVGKASDEVREKKISQCLINLIKRSAEQINGQTEHKSEVKKIDLKNEAKENCRISSMKNKTPVKNSSPCTHSCKHEEELKNELKKLQGVCDHHKDTKICDCTYCEVFGSTNSNHLHQTNETRNRLRIRLNQRKQKMVSKNPLVDKTNKLTVKPTLDPTKISTNKIEHVNSTTTTIPRIEPVKTVTVPKQTQPSPAKSADSVLKDVKNLELDLQKSKDVSKQQDDYKDIHGLVNYIEGNSGTDKVAIAEKKAAKKARQRQKKEDERRIIEEKEKRKLEEKRKGEEAKLRLQKQLEKEKNAALNEVKKSSKKNKNKNSTNGIVNNNNTDINTKLLEETIPATVTIKRSTDNGNNRPTITITLKGSTPDQDELLYTLVNGQTDSINIKEQTQKTKKNKNKQPQLASEQKPEHCVKLELLQKGKNGKSSNINNTNNNSEKEVKVSLTVNKTKTSNSLDKKRQATVQIQDKKKTEELDLPFLKLPPGITITKVDGPVSNKNYRVSMNDENDVQVNKSGVIVVDTEKLIQTKSTETSGKKNKKKRNKKQSNVPAQVVAASSENNVQPSQMVTLKNPIFKTFKENVAREPLPIDIAGASCGQASIFKNENGMVTIRSSRLQQSLTNGIPMHSLLSDLKPVLGDDVTTPISNNTITPTETTTTLSSFNAQEILSGLPGIEITKVDKRTPKPDIESKMCQVAQVSIIPTNGDKCNLDKDDWIYDNIFTPKDVLEDELDAEERELEAFKRFCQQSIPPKQKEKVAHLNVKDIVLKKKNDLNSV